MAIIGLAFRDNNNVNANEIGMGARLTVVE